MTNEIIKVTTNEEGQHLVDGRELHEVLKVEKAFTTWIQTQLENIDAIEGEEYCISFKGNAQFTQEQLKEMTTQQCSAYGVTVEYILTLDTAKEICMVVGVAPRTNAETKALSKQVRKYFIECEKQLKNNKPQLTQEQYNVLTLYEMGGQKAVAIAMEIKQSGIEVGLNIGKGQGMKRLCENGVVTIPIIMDYIKEHYPNEFAYTCDIPTTEWTRYLRHMGYLKTQHFARKDGKGMEAKWSYQPTEMFNEIFVEQGMAIVREIDKGRGKVEISYTIEIEKYLLTDNFKNTFFGYLDKIYPKIDEVVA